MKIELIQTKESDGNWYKVTVDGLTKSCTKIYPDKEAENLARATELYDFYVENKGQAKVIRSIEI